MLLKSIFGFSIALLLCFIHSQQRQMSESTDISTLLQAHSVFRFFDRALDQRLSELILGCYLSPIRSHNIK